MSSNDLPESPLPTATELVRQTIRAAFALRETVRSCLSRNQESADQCSMSKLLKCLEREGDDQTFLHIKQAMDRRSDDKVHGSTRVRPAMDELFGIRV